MVDAEGFVPDTITPTKSGLYSAILSAVCSGFLYSMAVSSQFIAANTYDNVLIIGADTFSKITDWKRRDCVFFGDGAGAAILTHANDGEGFIATKLYADGKGKFVWTIPAGGSEKPASISTVANREHFFRMGGCGFNKIT